jgi:hypothetical protein
VREEFLSGVMPTVGISITWNKLAIGLRSERCLIVCGENVSELVFFIKQIDVVVLVKLLAGQCESCLNSLIHCANTDVHWKIRHVGRVVDQTIGTSRVESINSGIIKLLLCFFLLDLDKSLCGIRPRHMNPRSLDPIGEDCKHIGGHEPARGVATHGQRVNICSQGRKPCALIDVEDLLS